MTAQREHVEYFAAATVEAIVADRSAVPLRTDLDERGRLFEAVAGELRPLVFQVAEMSQTEPDQLVAAAEYLQALLGREPLLSNPAWEAQRVVLGLFQMGLTNALAAIDRLREEERAALRPAYMHAAADDVTAAFDSIYIPPSDEEETVTSTDPDAPEPTDADLLALL